MLGIADFYHHTRYCHNPGRASRSRPLNLRGLIAAALRFSNSGIPEATQ